ncbi:hypothetical protein SAMN03097708_02786 [Thiohalomonas denitrificans]|uniref:Uncharacterized protein n=1 Tax=Thiohalomonas denitrificans TaxID=415747 RepID=A0A1G5QTA2_9GAMM|nr:hypothetical protein SAMN03097708_02786 [Thiohalomonas denitrificans]
MRPTRTLKWRIWSRPTCFPPRPPVYPVVIHSSQGEAGFQPAPGNPS